MATLNPLIPGFYADDRGNLYLNIREFLVAHGMPDAPELRSVVWDEIRDIFQEIAVNEIVD